VWRTRLKIAGVTLGATYALTVAVVAFGYRAFLYPAKRNPVEPEAPGASLVRIERDGSPVVYALHAVAPEGAPTVVSFHGNGEELTDEVRLVKALHDQGVGVLAVEYPGYGLAREQSANEDGIYAAAVRAIEYLRDSGVPREQIVVMGFSLGSGVAAEMAKRGLVSRVVLVAPYTSIPAVVSRFVPIVPTNLLIRDRFDTLSKAPSIDVPVLVIHGDSDEVIPPTMGDRVAGALPNVTVHIVRGGHHNDLSVRDPSLYQRIAHFALGRVEP
jgi:uncharacterized protein